MTKLYARAAEGGPWQEHPGELRPDGSVAFPDGAALPPATTFTVGVDLGQVNDFSAFCVLETRRLNPGAPGLPVFAHEVSHLERHRGELYPVIAGRVAALCAALPAPPVLAIDETGCGRGVADELRLAQPRTSWYVPTTITAGMDAAPQPDGSWHCAKRLLVGAVQVALQNGRLKVGKQLPLAPVLVKEMLAFRAKLTPSGNVTYGVPDTSDWRNGTHDDLVLAVALAIWAAERGGLKYVM